MPALKPNKQNLYQKRSRWQPSTQTNKTFIGLGVDARCQTKQTTLSTFLLDQVTHVFVVLVVGIIQVIESLDGGAGCSLLGF